MLSTANGGQKRMSASLEMEVQMIVNHHVTAGYPTHILCKKTKRSSPLSPIIFIVQMNMKKDNSITQIVSMGTNVH